MREAVLIFAFNQAILIFQLELVESYAIEHAG